MNIPTKLDSMSLEVLTNKNFDFSKLTVSDAAEMLKFWIYRFADPTKICAIWMYFIRKNNPGLFHLMANAVVDHSEKLYHDPQHPENDILYQVVFDGFTERCGKKQKQYPPIENLDVDEYLKSIPEEYWMTFTDH